MHTQIALYALKPFEFHITIRTIQELLSSAKTHDHLTPQYTTVHGTLACYIQSVIFHTQL